MAAAADTPEPNSIFPPVTSDDSDSPSVERTASELAAEKAYATAQAVALAALSTCVAKARDSGFFGVATKDPTYECANERSELLRYLPQDQAGQLVNQIQAAFMTQKRSR